MGRLVGQEDVIGNETTAERVVGGCLSIQEHVANMKRFFGDFGIDLNLLRNIYKGIDNERFTVQSYDMSPETDLRVILSSFYEYAQVTFAPTIYTTVVLTAKSDLIGPQKRLPAEYSSYYGLLR